MLSLGDIVLLDFPYSNQMGSKVRPGLIIGSNQHSSFNDIKIAYISTEVNSYSRDPSAVQITGADIAEGSLKRESIVRVDKAITVHDKQCRKVAAINKKKLDEVLRKATALDVENMERWLFPRRAAARRYKDTI